MSHQTLYLLSLTAASLLFVIPSSAQQPPCSVREVGPSAKVIPRLLLESAPSRTALEMVEHHLPTTFEVIGSALALRARGAAATEAVVEPLLLLDGVAMEGSIAQALDGLRAGDLARIEVHVGTAAAWRFRPGGAAAVIDVTTVGGAPARLGSVACRPPL